MGWQFLKTLQLETWTHIGAAEQFATTYQSIKGIIEHKSAPYSTANIVFCKDRTATIRTSMVRIAMSISCCALEACSTTTFDALSAPETAAFKGAFPKDAEYTLKSFRTDVIA